MRKLSWLLILLLALSMTLAACGGGDSDSDSGSDTNGADIEGDSALELDGDAATGEELYTQTTIGSAPGCVTCHSLAEGENLVGPSHAGMGARAAEAAAEGQSAEEFLYESIVNPGAIITDGYSDVMYQNYEEDLTDQQIADLVAFLMTQ